MPEPTSVQHVAVKANGTPVGDWTYTAAAPSGTRTVVIPASLIKDGDLRLDFSLPDATSPADHKLGPDPRKLGIYVNGLSVSQEYPSIKLGEKISLANTSGVPPYFMDGWSNKEPGRCGATARARA